MKGAPVSLGDIVFNVTDEAGTAWVVQDVEGWGGAGVTLELTQRPRAHGATVSESFLKPANLVLKGAVDAATDEALFAAVERLKSVAAFAPEPLAVVEAGVVRHMLVQRADAPIIKWIDSRMVEFDLQFAAPDPRKFGSLGSFTTGLPSSSGGRTYPAVYPITYTGVTETGVVQVWNQGDVQAPVWLRVDGPVPGAWQVTHVGSGRVLQVNLPLAAGEHVAVDMERREVLAQGQSSRSGWVTSRGWFGLDPGLNEIAFTAENFDAAAKLTVQTMSAWF
jgi:hypothetical protein